MSARKETVWFIALALPLSWALGFWWLLDERRLILIRLLMCVPGLVGIGCAWAFHREPPRAMGFDFTGWKPWLAALIGPPVMVLFCLGLAYTWRGLSGHTDFIFFQPEAFRVRGTGPRSLHGFAALRHVGAIWIAYLMPWLLVAVAYRWHWPDRLKAALPGRWTWLHHLFRLLLFVPTFLTHGIFPGELGEEAGWRGYLARRWADRPLVAVALTMPVWACFHLPFVVSRTQQGHPALNTVFLLSIAAGAVPYAALYLWSRSVWPCAVLHFTWNLWNPVFLGDVYTGRPTVFGGAVRIFNGEGLFGLIFNMLLAAGLLWAWRRRPVTSGLT